MRQSLQSKIDEAALDAGGFTVIRVIRFLCDEIDTLINRVEVLEKQLKGKNDEN